MTTTIAYLAVILLFINGSRCDGDCGIQNFQEKIVGGKVTAIDEYPWMALIRYKKEKAENGTWGCGGSLVGKKTIITAAHCVDNEATLSLGPIEFVRLGEWDYTTAMDCVEINNNKDCSDDPIDLRVLKTIIHPERTDTSKKHDIAILVLEKAAPYTDFIRPICLPETTFTFDEIDPKSGVLYVAGWGWTVGSVPSPSNIKMHVPVQYTNHSECQRSYNKNLIDATLQVCAGGKEGKNACLGDSGGGLMYAVKERWMLTGVVSFGPFPCGLLGFNGKPTVFTNVSTYLPWIKSVLLSAINKDTVTWEK